MEGVEFIKRNIAVAYVALSIGSLMLLFGSVYIIYKLSVLYGLGAGAALQGAAYNQSVIALLGPLASGVSTLGLGVLESFIAFVIALALGGGAFILLLSRRDVPTRLTSKYTLLNAVLSIIFILLYFLASLSIAPGFQSEYEYMPYIGFFICIVSVGYIEYVIRVKQPSRTGARGKSTVAINPSRPFSSMVSMQEQVFGNMSGHMKVIDKHFNSTALKNLYRLIGGSLGNFSKITILTSREMMNQSFTQDINDLKSELAGYSIELETRLMDPKDTVEQHERLMMDEKVAYKIPPFNIINTRSEHITKINFREADYRFSQLYSRAMKLDNYQVEKDRK